MRAWKVCGCVLLTAVSVGGCASPKALQPVAKQNHENIAALSQNVLAALSLAERFFVSSTEVLLGLRVGQVRKALIGVVGRPGAPPPPEKTWDELFKGKPPYVHQRREVEAVMKQNPEEARRRDLMRRHGWVYLTVMDTTFTPQKAHRLVEELDALQRKYASRERQGAFLRAAEAVLAGSDPTLASYRQEVEAAQRLLGVLKETITRQVAFADSHSRAILTFAQAEVDAGTAVSSFLGDEAIKRTLEELGRQHIKDETLRKAALGLLTDLPNALSSASR